MTKCPSREILPQTSFQNSLLLWESYIAALCLKADPFLAGELSVCSVRSRFAGWARLQRGQKPLPATVYLGSLPCPVRPIYLLGHF